MSDSKDTDDYDYFKFIPGKMYFGFGCYCAFSWIADSTNWASLWVFLFPVLYLTYYGNRKIILFSLAGLTVFLIQTLFMFEFGKKGFGIYILNFIITLFTYPRDMYFIWEHRLNAFTYSAKTETSRKIRLFFAALGFLAISAASIFGYIAATSLAAAEAQP